MDTTTTTTTTTEAQRAEALECAEQAIRHALSHEQESTEAQRKQGEVLVWASLADGAARTQVLFEEERQQCLARAEQYGESEVHAPLQGRQIALAERYEENIAQFKTQEEVCRERERINADWIDLHAERAIDAWNAMVPNLQEAHTLLLDDSVPVPELSKRPFSLGEMFWNIRDNIKRIQGWGKEKERSAGSVAFAKRKEEQYHQDAQTTPGTASYSDRMAQTYSKERQGVYDPQLDQHTRYNNDHQGQALAWLAVTIKYCEDNAPTKERLLKRAER